MPSKKPNENIKQQEMPDFEKPPVEAEERKKSFVNYIGIVLDSSGRRFETKVESVYKGTGQITN